MIGSMARGHIEVESNWAGFEAEVGAAAAAGMREWGEVTKRAIVARETRVGDASPSRRISPGVHLRDTFRVSAVFGGLRGRIRGERLGGLYVLVYTPDENAIWQELGTRGRRRKKLKQPTNSHVSRAAGSGVKPLRFMANGLKDSYAEGVEILQRAVN